MTNNEIELLTLIRESDNPEQSLHTAIEIILAYLTHPESFESKPFVDSQEQA